MTYLDSGVELSALAATPLDSSLRNVPIERLIARLRDERGQFESGLLAGDASAELLVLLLAERADGEALAQSICSLGLQSHPGVRCVIVPAGEVDPGELRRFTENVTPRPGALEVWPTLDAERRAELAQARFVTFLRHGDRLHPSATAWLAVERVAGRAAEVVAWGELQPDGAGGAAWAQRNPSLHRIALLHFPYLRNAFAVAGPLAAAYPGNLAEEARSNDLHLFQIWLSRRDVVRWASHPEYFLIRADARVAERPEGAARRAFDAYPDAYAKRFAELFPELAFRVAPRDAAAPYQLVPRRAPENLSVVVPFRDKPDLTARAARSIAAQRFPGAVEIVLINNRSSDEALRDLRAELARLPGDANWRIVDYDAPFNHSAQCSLGVRESRGEVVLFMNNDAELIGADALVELAAWAAWPGVASVGAALEEPRTRKVAAGMEPRLRPQHYFESIVEERSDPAFTPHVREVFGNSFAFAAVPRAAFEALGGLDPLRFPNGYNDVDFACRAQRAGYCHVALGHIRVRHATGQSRARTDESVQKTLLRTLYPELTAAALTELRFDDSFARREARPQVGAAVRPALEPPSGMRKLMLKPMAQIAAVLGRLRLSSRTKQAAALVAASSLFDRKWYVAQYPDVAGEGIDPALHYVLHGAAEGRDPGPAFDSRGYLETHKDVAEAGFNPLLHYLRHGKAEGRELGRSPATALAGSVATEEPMQAVDPVSFSLAQEPVPSSLRQQDLPAETLTAFSSMMGLPVASLQCSAAHMVDIWYANDRDLRVRFDTAGGEACVARFFQYDLSPGGGLVMAGESLLRGRGADFADVVPANPFLPLLMTLSTCEGRLLAASLLPFPSLCRGGVHYGELCAVEREWSYLESLQSLSRSLLGELLGEAGAAQDFSLARIEIDLQGATGAERIFSEDLREWLAQVMHIAVIPSNQSSSSSYLEESLAPMPVQGRSGVLILKLPADSIPALRWLVSRRLQVPAGEGTAVGSFVVADDATASPRLMVAVPPLGEELVALQPAGAAVGFPVLTRLSRGASDAAAETLDAGPVALRFRDRHNRHPARLIMPIAPDASGPLLRKANGHGAAATISVLVAPSPQATDAFDAFLESLALQTLGEAVEVIAVVEAGAVKRAAESALWRFFPGRYRLVEPDKAASRNARINRAAGHATGKFLLIAGANVALHDARTLETLCSVADHDRVASAGCVLLHVPNPQKPQTLGFRSGGVFLTASAHSATPLEVFAEPDCLDAFGVATYPVAANSSALFMARADVWRSLGGFDAGRYPDAGGGDIDYGVRAAAKGFRHLCTSVISAEVYRGDFRAPYAEEAADAFAPAEVRARLAASACVVSALKA